MGIVLRKVCVNAEIYIITVKFVRLVFERSAAVKLGWIPGIMPVRVPMAMPVRGVRLTIWC